MLGCCEKQIPRDARWSVRLSYVGEKTESGKQNLVRFYPEARFCVKRSVDPDSALRCVRLADVDDLLGLATGVIATTTDLERNGIDLRIYGRNDTGTLLAWRHAAIPRDTPLGPVSLCVGFVYRDLQTTTLREPTVAVFLDLAQ
ncbi:MAG: hypothetical protein R3F14_20915 [Polyangiaceae bacterium]